MNLIDKINEETMDEIIRDSKELSIEPNTYLNALLLIHTAKKNDWFNNTTQYGIFHSEIGTMIPLDEDEYEIRLFNNRETIDEAVIESNLGIFRILFS